ncbi:MULTISPECIES: PilW family protein [Methylomicrobium]|uniref:Prepilin-type N-terminal cleavage/methylation domain-containing protein n=1 Tax=Methylomicrobium album BG8 TaxID=686340 RepID=H8GK29_METAL|nr:MULTISPECIES: PilW family protein [Methylomicrobium]EIC29153.1 hypothetical protein Metal_1366 [Methylomicrobium album BG8]
MKNWQTGATLIELMISLVLGLALIASISSLFLQMQKINRSQRALNNMTDDARYVQEILQKEIRRTGGLRSRMDNDGIISRVFLDEDVIEIPDTGISFDLNAAEYVKGVSQDNPANDAFVIRYQLLDADDLSPANLSNSSSPCTVNSLLDTGEDPAEAVHVVRIYFFVNNGSLLCTSQRSVAGVCNTDSGKNCALTDMPVTLIENVQSLTVLYGIDADADHAANYYAEAAGVEPDVWQNVVSMRLSVVLKSENTHLVQQVRPYKVEETEITPSDHSLYRVFTTTIALRNQL